MEWRCFIGGLYGGRRAAGTEVWFDGEIGELAAELGGSFRIAIIKRVVLVFVVWLIYFLLTVVNRLCEMVARKRGSIINFARGVPISLLELKRRMKTKRMDRARTELCV